MPERLPMRHLREILRLRYECKLSQREIGRSLSIGLGTVSEFLGRAARAGLCWPVPEGWDDQALSERFYPARAGGRPRPMPEMASLHAELRRPGVTLSRLWVEYLEAHPGGYRYSQFCEHYRRWTRKLSPTMRQVHRAGEKVFLDFSGVKPHLVNRATGEIVEVELFVSVLGASNYTYAEAVESQELSSWCGAHVRMLEYFGGVPEIFVPDNLKSAITQACRYEPVVNRTYQELASHYGAVVIPARPYKPRDKAKVEVGIQVAQRFILAALRNRTFFDLASLNAAIRERLEALNNRPIKKLGLSRRELFERLDGPALRPLPAVRFELAAWKDCGVNIDYHIVVDHNYYSVPYQLTGERVEARVTEKTVEIYFKSRRVASHLRSHGHGHYTTEITHMPQSHRDHAEWSPSRLIAWAKKTGEATGSIVEKILADRPHPEQGYRSCLGLLRLSKRYGEARTETACQKAVRLSSYSYQTVKNILAAGLEASHEQEPAATTSTTLPVHENIRGAGYYQKEMT
jgi:transposase